MTHMRWPLQTVGPTDGLSSWPSPNDEFLEITTADEVAALRQQVEDFDDGVMLACRGRDSLADDWDYGYCTKLGCRLYFHYCSGDMESFRISYVNFRKLVQLALRSPDQQIVPVLDMGPQHVRGVIIIAHGWSPDGGPNYPLIRKLEAQAKFRGWGVTVPDFRPAYEHSKTRSRAERVVILYEELLCMQPPPPFVAFVGHSQGGAAAAYACTDRLCAAWDVRGLLMIGSENPLSLDNMDWRPKVPNLHILHATGDNVIPCESLRRCAEQWGCQFTELSSSIPEGAKDRWGDDINHDFLAPDLIRGVTLHFNAFLDGCERQAEH